MKTTKKGLSAGQLSMMAFGTVIGGSFFLGSSVAIRTAGPSIIISYTLGGLLVYFILFSLSEMTVADAAPGSFRTYSEQAFGRGVGFITGWVYWTGLILAMSSEAVAASLLIKTWLQQVPIPALGAGIIILTTLANLLGADKLSRLESALSFVKLFAITGFIVISLALVSGMVPGKPALGLGAVAAEPLFPGGVAGAAGGMLIVMFTYAGFEIIGLAASEADNPHKTVPKAILYTVVGLSALYILAIGLILPQIPTAELSAEASPMAAALGRSGIDWAAEAVNIVMATAILSTMLAATFGLGRMMRTLADEGHAPSILKDRGDIPYRGIVFSGAAMLLGLSLSLVLPSSLYVFLVSSGGFSLLFTYVVIVATHYRFRRKNGCPPEGKCQLPGFPYTSWLTLGALTAIIATMPLVPGQASGLVAGIALVLFYMLCYLVKHLAEKRLKLRGR